MDNRMELYKKGLIDREIAEIEGVSSSAIRQWRKVRDLSPNKNKVSDRKKLALYNLGYTDKQIAGQLGLTIHNIWYWRNKNNLMPNPKRLSRFRDDEGSP